MNLFSNLCGWLGVAAIVLGIAMSQDAFAKECSGCTKTCAGATCNTGSCTGTSKCETFCGCKLNAGGGCDCA
jgi:hypothetical protein